MRKIFFTYYTGLCGSDGHEVIEFEDGITDEELDTAAWEGALSNAEMYGIYTPDAMPDDYDDEAEDNFGGDEYSDDICGTWCEYDEDKHVDYVT